MENNKNAEAIQMLIKELKIERLPQKKQDEIIAEMGEALFKEIFIETMEKLGEEGRKKYIELSEKKDIVQADIDSFLDENIENYDEFVKGIIDNFKEDLLKVANKN